MGAGPMRFDNAAIPAGMVWSSPFVRWQGSLAELSSLDVAVDVTATALGERRVDPGQLDGVVLGSTVPQPDGFAGVPVLAARIGAPGITGPMVGQTCVTSVACLAVAAAEASNGGGLRLAVAADRTSGGPTLCYPEPSAPGGAPLVTNWVLDSIAADPLEAADKAAADCGLSREQLDELAALRFGQYERALARDREFQRRYMVPVRAGKAVIDGDEGVLPAGPPEISALRAAEPDGLHTHLTQARPADGAAGAIVATVERARDLARGEGVTRILATGSSAGSGPGPTDEAHVSAARAALRAADLRIGQVDAVVTHSTFAVGDISFARRTGFPAERMNSYGCSLVYGHPRAPTGLRAVAELVTELRLRGGGIGLFTGCAAGGTAAAIVLRADD